MIRFAEVDFARLRRPLLLASFGVERDGVIVERHKKDLAAIVGQAARHHVAAGDALSSAVRVWNVGPLELASRASSANTLFG